VFVFEHPAREDLEAAVGWMWDRDVPFRVTTTAPLAGAVEGLAGDLDLVPTGEIPGMALGSLDGIAPSESVAAISEVTDAEGLEAFAATFATSFDVGDDVARRLHPTVLLTDDDLRFFLARVDGRAVGCGMLARSGDVAGVYTVGVVDGSRQRGIGTAVTRAVLRAGREAGCAVGALQASELGDRIYERMGFETVVTYRLFESATPTDY
jgi:GNAT superfamily N-acetyltransferase